MRLIVGLGNPGSRYQETRHNIGFEVLDELQRRIDPGLRRKSKFNAQLVETRNSGRRIALLWPQTFMNRSGDSVRPAVDFYKLAAEDVLVISDDFQLDLGVLRFRREGSAGGQKGLADILQKLGTQKVPRLRVGVGPLPTGWDSAGFVLGKFDRSQRELADDVVGRAADGAIHWVEEGVESAMNRYNGDAGSQAK